MVLPYGFEAAYAGQYALAAAAIPSHYMVGAGAQHYHLVCIFSDGVYAHLRTEGSGAYIDKILCLTVVVYYPDPVVNAVRHQSTQLIFVAARVSAVGDYYGDVVLVHIALIGQIADYVGHHKILPHPEAGHVADYEHHLIFWIYPGFQRLVTDRRTKRHVKSGPYIVDLWNGGAVKLCNVCFIKGEGDAALAVFQGVVFHAAPLF